MSSSTGASVDMDLQQTANSSGHFFELCAGGEGHEAVAGGDSCRRATASSVSSALSSAYNNNKNTRARSLARPRVGSTAGKHFPVALGGGYLMVLITSGSGNSGTQPLRKKEPPDPRLQGPDLPNQRPSGSIYWKQKFQSKNKPPVLVISKNLKEGSGSMKEPAVFWAISHLTRLKKKLENHGYIYESDIGFFDIHGYITKPEHENLMF